MSFRRTLCALTAATIFGLNSFSAFPYSQNTKHGFYGASFAFGDVDRDGLTDMVVANGSTVSYFRNKDGSTFEYKQKVYTSKKKEKMEVTLLTIKGESQLIIMSPSEFKTYRVNNKGIFEEKDFELEWMEDDSEEEPKPIKDAV